MKYCIGCVHLDFNNADPGWSTECTAGIDKRDAEFACGKGHWRRDVNEYEGLNPIEKAMQQAETCPDYTERSDES